jgi:archaellum component FlaF (FlaF/FlaG flagellin family)
MLAFQVNIEDNGNSQVTTEMANVILDSAVAAIKAKAQELFLNCSVDVSVNIEVSPVPAPT